jgi:hypothetical protein
MPGRWIKFGADEKIKDRRADARIVLPANTQGTLHYKSARIPCQVLDICLSGCCLRCEKPFAAGALAHVEVVLPVQGMVLRIDGITQWVSVGRILGIRFIHPSTRTKSQMAGLLTCLVDQSAAEEVKAAVASATWDRSTALYLDPDPPPPPPVASVAARAVKQETGPVPPLESLDHGNAPGVQCRDEKEWPTTIRFLRDNSQIHGHLLYLSLGGCRVKIAQKMPLESELRVEVGFQLLGLPFRLGGLTQSIHGHLMDIRISEMSSRIRQELVPMIEELRARKAALPVASESAAPASEGPPTTAEPVLAPEAEPELPEPLLAELTGLPKNKLEELQAPFPAHAEIDDWAAIVEDDGGDSDSDDWGDAKLDNWDF